MSVSCRPNCFAIVSGYPHVYIILGLQTRGTKVRRAQTAQERDCYAIAALRFLYHFCAPGGELFPFGYSEYSALLQVAWQRLQFSDLGLSPRSM